MTEIPGFDQTGLPCFFSAALDFLWFQSFFFLSIFSFLYELYLRTYKSIFEKKGFADLSILYFFLGGGVSRNMVFIFLPNQQKLYYDYTNRLEFQNLLTSHITDCIWLRYSKILVHTLRLGYFRHFCESMTTILSPNILNHDDHLYWPDIGSKVHRFHSIVDLSEFI